MKSTFHLVTLLLFFSFLSGCKKENEPSRPATIYFTGYDPGIGSPGVNWSEIYSISSDGSNLARLTDFSDNGTRNIQAVSVGFNADSSRLIFSSNKNAAFLNFDLYSIKPDGSDLIQHTNSAGRGSGYFNPAGYQLAGNVEQILFEHTYTGDSTKYESIKSTHLDGSPFTVHTQYPADGSCYEPSMNIAKLKMIYISDKSGTKDIYVTDLSATVSPKEQLTFDGKEKHNPQFSANGNRISFSVSSDTGVRKSSEIIIMDADGNNKTQITNYSNSGALPIITGHPVFSPAGTEIFYLSNESGTTQVYRMNIDGSNKQRITSSAILKYNLIVK